MKIQLSLHGMTYRPILPQPKIIRTRGVVNQTALVVFWLWWVLEIERLAKPTRPARPGNLPADNPLLKAPESRIERAWLAGV